MANNQDEPMDKYSKRHPARIASSAFMVGTALGAGLMAAKHQRNKSSVQKLMDRLNSKMPN
jgi:hypothetical protein